MVPLVPQAYLCSWFGILNYDSVEGNPRLPHNLFHCLKGTCGSATCPCFLLLLRTLLLAFMHLSGCEKPMSTKLWDTGYSIKFSTMFHLSACFGGGT